MRGMKGERIKMKHFVLFFFSFPPEQGTEMKSYLQTVTEDKRSGLLLGRSTTEKENYKNSNIITIITKITK